MQKKQAVILLIVLNLLLSVPMEAKFLKHYNNYTPIEKLLLSETKGTLLMSDSPELVYNQGILYRDTLIGNGRLLYHHVNATHHSEWQLIIIAENLTKEPQLLSVNKACHEGPSFQFLHIGQQVLKQYFMHQSSQQYFIQPNERHVLYTTANHIWPKGSLYTGMLDVTTSGPIQVTYAMAPAEMCLEEILNLPSLARDGEPRGTFSTLGRDYAIIIPNQGMYYTLLGEKTEWEEGIDGITKGPTMNEGNYGIMYHIKMIALEDTTVILCPRGGIFQGIVYWDEEGVIPVQRSHYFKRYKERIKLGELKKGDVKWLHYMLPNGSAAPVLLGFEVNQEK